MMENVSISLYQIQDSFRFFIPEIILACTFIAVIVLGLVFKSKQVSFIPVSVFIGLILLTLADFQQICLLPAANLFSGMVFLDLKVIYFKFLFAGCGLLTLAFSMLNKQIKAHSDQYAEYYAFIIAIILGSHLMVMAANLLLVFLALEIISVSSYILVAFVINKKTGEASMKYILFGMFSSGVMLYGLSFLFGFTGTLHFTTPEFINNLSAMHPLPVLWAVSLTMAGVLFKISAFPFHLWAPDIYESTPSPLVAFFSTISKIAGLGLLINLLHALAPYDFSVYFPGFNLSLLVGALAMLTIAAGNFPALLQKNAKRMLGYSAIAQSGFILLPLAGNNLFALETLLFYTTTYSLMSFAAFFIIDKLSEGTVSGTIEDYKGTGLQYPLWGIFAIVAMISLTGLPPTAGFMAKLLIFSSLWQSYLDHRLPFLLFLFVFGLLNSVVALFYYLKIPFFMFLRKSERAVTIPLTFADYLFAGGLTIFILLFFFKADFLTALIRSFLNPSF